MKISLFGQSSKNKVKVWSGEVTGSSSLATMIIEHGYLDGKQQREERVFSTGKNIGKANETTPFEQACKELESLANKKRDSGYGESISEIPDMSKGFFLPMLAHTWADHSQKIRFPAIAQPKFDGARMLCRKEGKDIFMWTRKGKPITTLKEIAKSLCDILTDGETFDGEIYKHGWSFQRIISAIKKRSADTSLLEYHIYDSPNNLPYDERFVNRWGVCNIDQIKYLDEDRKIVLSPTIKISSREELFLLEDKAIEALYEGLMVRNYRSKYEYKNRSYDLLKLKRFEDSDYKILGGKEGSGRDAGTVIFSCEKDGKSFDVRPTGTIEERTEYFKNLNKYIGKLLTVKHQGFTDDGLPRFPVGLRIRPDWDA